MRVLICSLLVTLVIANYGPITQDFNDFLEKKGYGQYDFARKDLGDSGSFGGRAEGEKRGTDDLNHDTPVLFIHGNSDSALASNNFSTGFQNTVEYFLSKGYKFSEMYATSWGDTNTTAAVYRDHDCYTLRRLRVFMEAVLEYTKMSQLHVISHSMGVTLGRKIIQGGEVDGRDGYCHLGRSLVKNVDVFVGMAGGNYGLCTCVGPTAGLPTCNQKNGLWPGETCGKNDVSKCGVSPLPFSCPGNTYSAFLMNLNKMNTRDGKEVFSVWSTADDLIQFNDFVWGKPTSYIPLSTGKKVYNNYTHMETKELTAPDQYYMVTKKSIPQ